MSNNIMMVVDGGGGSSLLMRRGGGGCQSTLAHNESTQNSLTMNIPIQNEVTHLNLAKKESTLSSPKNEAYGSYSDVEDGRERSDSNVSLSDHKGRCRTLTVRVLNYYSTLLAFVPLSYME